MRLTDADWIADYMRRLVKVAEDRLNNTDADDPLHDRYLTQWYERCECLALIENVPSVDAVPREEYEEMKAFTEREYERVKADRDSWEEAWRES